MDTENPTSLGPMLLTFLAGAALGAVAVALTTPRSGPDLRGGLRSLARRAQRRASDLAENAGSAWDEMKLRAIQAATDFKHGIAVSVDDLRGGPSGALPYPSQPNNSEVIK
jgi:gas vesicle protein